MEAWARQVCAMGVQAIEVHAQRCEPQRCKAVVIYYNENNRMVQRSRASSRGASSRGASSGGASHGGWRCMHRGANHRDASLVHDMNLLIHHSDIESQGMKQ